MLLLTKVSIVYIKVYTVLDSFMGFAKCVMSCIPYYGMKRRILLPLNSSVLELFIVFLPTVPGVN